MVWVFLQNNIVSDVARVDPFGIFGVEYAAKFIQAPDDVSYDWTYENGVFIPPVIAAAPSTPPIPTKEELLAQLQILQAQIDALT